LLSGLEVYADGEFLNVTFTADNPMLVESIATKHVENAFDYYAQVRAKPATVALQFIDQQMTGEIKALGTAQKALLDFKIKHEMDSLPREITAIQDQLRALRLERAKMVPEREKQTAISAKYVEDATRTTSVDAAANYLRLAASQDAIVAGIRAQEVEYDKLIAQQETTLTDLLNLTAELDVLMRDTSRVQSNYEFLAGKENEARLKQSQAKNVSFIQIVEPARMPDRPAPSRTPRLLMIGAVVSVIAGVILAFVLELISVVRASGKKEEA